MSKRKTYGLLGSLYMKTFHQKKVLINEQQIGDTNPLFEIARTLHST